MTALAVDIEHDLPRGLVFGRIAGTVNRRNRTQLHEVVTRCLSDIPHSVIIDLAHAVVAESAGFAAFRQLTEVASRDPGVGLSWCTSNARLAERLRSLSRAMVVCRDEEEGVRRALAHPSGSQWAHEQFSSAPETPSLARLLVGDACLRWGLSHLLDPARLVVSELVNNAVEHAGGELRVTVGLREPYLIMTVRDGSAAPPVRQPAEPRRPVLGVRGRGLLVVEAYSADWGWVSTGHGKSVWATLHTAGPARSIR